MQNKVIQPVQNQGVYNPPTVDLPLHFNNEDTMSKVVGSLLYFISSEIQFRKGVFCSLPVDSTGSRDDITDLLEIVGMRLMYQNINRERIEFCFPHNPEFTEKLILLLQMEPIEVINFCGHLLDVDNNTVEECLANALSQSNKQQFTLPIE